MKEIFFTLLLYFVSLQGFSQYNEKNIIERILPVENGEENTLYSLPTYDSMGNFFQVKKRFDHLPTQTDSIEFAKNIFIEIDKLMKEFGKEQQRYYDSIDLIQSNKKNITPKKKRKIGQ